MKTQAAIQTFLHNRQAKNLRPRTIQWYEQQLARFASLYPEFPLEPGPIEEFLTHLPGTPETRHAYYRTLKVLYRFVCRRNRRPNPMELIDPPRCPKKLMPTLEMQEMMRLLNSATTLRDRTLLTLLTDNGARAGEIASLRKQDIGDSTIRVRGKTGEREIPISDETRRLLLSLIASDGKDEHVFLGQHGPLTRSGIYRIVRICMGKAGIGGPKLGPARLRHAFGKGYVVNGGDLRSLQEIMGHTSITTTQKYASLNLNDLIAKHCKFTPLKAAHAAAQESFFDTHLAIKEAEAILERRA